jgi:hypothetical protein
MPIDASLFMQFANQRAQENANLQNALSQGINNYTTGRMLKEEIDLKKQEMASKGLDFDKLVQNAAINIQSGKGTPQDYQYLQAKDLIDGPKMVFDPATQNLVSSGTIMDRLESLGPRQYNPSFPPLGQSTMPGQMNAVPPLSMDQLEQPMGRMGVNPPPALTPQQQQALNARGDVMNRPAIPLPQVITPVGASSRIAQAAQEANVDVQKTAAQADISSAAKGAESYASKTGQLAAENEAKLPAIQGFIEELSSFGKENVEKLPSGMGQSTAAFVSNKLGYPTESAIAQADLDSRLPTLMGQAKQIVRQAGEGAFTDYDAQSLEKMIWKPDDSMAVKIKKYETILGAMQRAEKRITGKSKEFTSQNKPGFKYLGSE